MNEELRVIITAEIEDLKRKVDAAQKEIKDLGTQGSSGFKKFGEAAKGVGKAVGNALKVAGTAIIAAGSALIGLGASTKEYQASQAKLVTAFEVAGSSAEVAKEVYLDLYRVLGDSDQATEAAAHLAQMTTNQKELEQWTTICQGVYATFGESLPIESLTEAANETAKTGELTGALADALNWAGVAEEDFQAQLLMCNDEAEREALIRQTLSGLYDDAAAAYERNAAALLAENEAQAKLTDALAQMGAVGLPILTTLKLILAELVTQLTPFVTLIGQGFKGALEGAAGASEMIAEGLSGLLDTLITMINNAVPAILEVIVDLIPAIITTLVGQLPNVLNVIIDGIVQIINALTAMLPDIVAAIVEVIPQLIIALMEAWPQVLQAGIDLLMAIVDAIPFIITELLNALPDIIDSICDYILTGLPMILQAAIDLFMKIVQAIPVIIEKLGEVLPDVITTIIDTLIEAVPMIIDAAITLLMAIIDAIPVIIDALVEALPKIINAIIDGLLDALPVTLDAAVELLMAIVQAIPQIISILVQDLPKIITSIVNTLVSRAPDVMKGAVQLLMGVVKAIPQIVKELVKNMPQIIKSIINGLKNGMSQVKEVGKNLIKGLWNGIKDMVGWIKDKIKGFGQSILNGLKDFFGIKSPSRVMESIVGKNLALGIGEGFMKNIAGVNKEIEDSIKPLTADRHFSIGGSIDAPVAMNTSNDRIAPIAKDSQSFDKLAALLGKREGNTTIVLQVDKTTLGKVVVDGINDITKLTGTIPLAFM